MADFLSIIRGTFDVDSTCLAFRVPFGRGCQLNVQSKCRNIFDGLLKMFENDSLKRVAIVVLRMNSKYPSDATHVWSVPMIDNKGTSGLLEFFRDRSPHDVKCVGA